MVLDFLLLLVVLLLLILFLPTILICSWYLFCRRLSLNLSSPTFYSPSSISSNPHSFMFCHSFNMLIPFYFLVLISLVYFFCSASHYSLLIFVSSLNVLFVIFCKIFISAVSSTLCILLIPILVSAVYAIIGLIHRSFVFSSFCFCCCLTSSSSFFWLYNAITKYSAFIIYFFFVSN